MAHGYAHSMQVSIRLFAGLRERAGTGARTLELTDGATLGDVWPALDLGDRAVRAALRGQQALRRDARRRLRKATRWR